MESVPRWKTVLLSIFEWVLCKLGAHTWQSSLDDYLEEFGALGLSDNKVCSKSKCSVCGKQYKKDKKC